MLTNSAMNSYCLWKPTMK